MTPTLPAHAVPEPPSPARQAQMRAAADKLEAAFLSQMLKDAGLGPRQGGFGGGVGEDQFTSLMRNQQAEQMVGAGGIGLSDQLFEALMQREMRHV